MGDTSTPGIRRPGRITTLALALSMVGAATACGAQDRPANQPWGISGTWRPAFVDTFDGKALDSGKWSLGNPTGDASDVTVPVNTDERQCYDPDLVSVAGGALRIEAVRKEVSCGGRTMQYASGMVNTRGHFELTHGVLEARIHLPAAARGVIANWPAFWSVGATWPTDGEIDVMEGLDGQACFHTHSELGPKGGCAEGDYTGWHTYGAQWRPGRVDYYYDGVRVGTITQGVKSRPEWLMLNYSVQPTVGGPTKVPAEMKVDYVRVWQQP